MTLRPILPAVVAMLLFSCPCWANSKYFQSVKKAASAYRVEAELDNMKVVTDADGGKAFYITLKSSRNNYEMVLLVGYIAAGEAMKTGFEPADIYVSVDVPLGEGFRLITTATKKDVKDLLSGKINTAQFVRKVKYL